jgi:hypothetical protein
MPKKAKTGTAVAVVNSEPAKDWHGYATKIAAAWQKTTEAIIETGRLLNEAKAEVEHGDWLKLVEALPFGARTAQMLMAIAANPVLSNPNHGSHLPPSWRTLYELTKLDDQVLLAKIEDHSIHPDIERKDVALRRPSLERENDLREAKMQADWLADHPGKTAEDYEEEATDPVGFIIGIAGNAAEKAQIALRNLRHLPHHLTEADAATIVRAIDAISQKWSAVRRKIELKSKK